MYYKINNKIISLIFNQFFQIQEYILWVFCKISDFFNYCIYAKKYKSL